MAENATARRFRRKVREMQVRLPAQTTHAKTRVRGAVGARVLADAQMWSIFLGRGLQLFSSGCCASCVLLNVQEHLNPFCKGNKGDETDDPQKKHCQEHHYLEKASVSARD